MRLRAGGEGCITKDVRSTGPSLLFRLKAREEWTKIGKD